jgi:uncharacterized membrane protein
MHTNSQQPKEIGTRATLVVLAAIVLAGTSLRFTNIGAKELWYDEAFTARVLSYSYTDIVLFAKTLHPPLYYILLKAWTGLFGTSELALRAPSAIVGVLTIPLAYWLVSTVTSTKKRALWAALVVAVNPFLITYSQEARSYALLAFLTVLATLVALQAMRTKKYLAFAAVLPVLFLTHYVALFGIVALIALVVYDNKKAAVYLLPLVIVAAAWLPILVGNLTAKEPDWIPRYSWIRVPQSLHAFLLGVDTNKTGLLPPVNPLPLNTTIVSIVIGVGVAAVVLKARAPGREELMLAASGVIPIALVALTSMYLSKHMYVERYLIGYATLLILYLVGVLPKPWMLIPYSLLSVYLVLSFKPISAGFRALASYTEARPVVMIDATEYITAKYYLPTVKLQDGDWRDWGIITAQDIAVKAQAQEDFYLVNRQGLEGWEPKFSIGDFKFYDWTAHR